MELFGILFSVPVAFVASMIYCALLAWVVSEMDRVRRLFLIGSLIVLGLFATELTLLYELGAVGSRAVVGPGFYPAHVMCFLLGTPALANVLVLGRRVSLARRWYIGGILCTIFAVFLVVLQYSVSEALYGPSGTEGPYSKAPVFQSFPPSRGISRSVQA